MGGWEGTQTEYSAQRCRLGEGGEGGGSGTAVAAGWQHPVVPCPKVTMYVYPCHLSHYAVESLGKQSQPRQQQQQQKQDPDPVISDLHSPACLDP